MNDMNMQKGGGKEASKQRGSKEERKVGE